MVLWLSDMVFAGAVFTNDTGQVAYGFRIVFAAPVTIASHAPRQVTATFTTLGDAYFYDPPPEGSTVVPPCLPRSPGPVVRESRP